jgi:putative transcriptional regulator
VETNLRDGREAAGIITERYGELMRSEKGKRKERKSFGQSAIDNLKEFLDAADRGEQITVRRVKLNLEPRRYTADEIKWTRERLRVSQAIFAQLMGVSPKTIEAWEAGTNRPDGPVHRLLEEINLNPMEFLRRHLSGSAEMNTATGSLRQLIGG